MYTSGSSALYQRLVAVLAVIAVLASLIVSPAVLAAAAIPTVVVSPSSAAPGETVTLSGSGWPAGAIVGASLATAAMPAGATASLGAALAVNAAGAFTGQATIPLTLFGNGSRANLNVVPGSYLVTVGGGANPRVQAPFTVGAPAHGTLLWGSVAFDANGNRVRDAGDPAAAGVGVTLTLSTGGVPPAQAITDALGRYLILDLAAGNYSLASQAAFQSAPYAGKSTARAVAGQAVRADLLLVAPPVQQVRPPATAGSRATLPAPRVPAQLPATGGGGMGWIIR